MTGAEVRKLSDEEITVELRRLRDEVYRLRSQTVTEKIEDTSRFGKMKKDIARLMTEQRAREIAAAS
ncbi:MAG: 50S ribosomal protein L29 [Planctomycetota bacterium]